MTDKTNFLRVVTYNFVTQLNSSSCVGVCVGIVWGCVCMCLCEHGDMSRGVYVEGCVWGCVHVFGVCRALAVCGERQWGVQEGVLAC